jgi:hypothetical protein
MGDSIKKPPVGNVANLAYSDNTSVLDIVVDKAVERSYGIVQ